MLLRSSISSTKKFFHKTLHNVKSLFSGGYHRLPKTPPHPHNSYSCSADTVLDVKDNFSNYKDDLEKLDQFYTDFTEQWGLQQDKAKGRNDKTAIFSSHMRQVQEISVSDADEMLQTRGGYSNEDKMQMLNRQRARKQVDSSYGSKGTLRDQKNYAMAQKLKELEMLDKGNADYVLDIEEVLHYYSRLTSPAYLEIVDKFFMEIYSELFDHTRPSSSGVMNSMRSLRSVKS